jgi:hypothetical protein
MLLLGPRDVQQEVSPLGLIGRGKLFWGVSGVWALCGSEVCVYGGEARGVWQVSLTTLCRVENGRMGGTGRVVNRVESHPHQLRLGRQL